MDDIYYLVHTTNKYTEEWTELRTSNIDAYEDQFPGAYLTLITKDNIHNIQLFDPSNKQILIFSKRLLEQKNFHINLQDYNGYISENNTYFPWNLNEAVKKINDNKGNVGNEVIFHDAIPMDYLCLVINNLSPVVSNNMIIPNIPIENEVEADKTKEPFYCYPLEKNYSGINPFPESSRAFFVKMAKTCNVDSRLSTDNIINKIKTKIPYLYANRNKQQINVLKKTGDKKKTRRKRCHKRSKT